MSGARGLAWAALGAWLVYAPMVPSPSHARPRGPQPGEETRLAQLTREALLAAVPYPRGKVAVRSLRVPRPRGSERFVRATVELRARERYRGATSFAVRFEADDDAEPMRVWATADLRVRVPMVVAARDLRAGHTLTAGDVERVERFLDTRQEAGVASAEGLIGQKARRSIRAFEVVRPADLAKPTLVRRGEFVQLIVRMGGLVAMARGRSLGEGAHGDSVAVESLGSGKKVVGRVDERGRVTVEF